MNRQLAVCLGKWHLLSVDETVTLCGRLLRANNQGYFPQPEVVVFRKFAVRLRCRQCEKIQRTFSKVA